MTEENKTLLSQANTYVSVGLLVIIILVAIAFATGAAKVSSLEDKANDHVSKDVYDNFQREILDRLNKIEEKIDRIPKKDK